MHQAMLKDLRQAEHFIFLEYFIIEEGVFWNSILEILKKRPRWGWRLRSYMTILVVSIPCPVITSGHLAATGSKPSPFQL